MAYATISPATAAALRDNRRLKDSNPDEYRATKAELFADLKADLGIHPDTHVKVEIDDRDDPDYLVVKGRRDTGEWGYIDADTGAIRPDSAPQAAGHVPHATTADDSGVTMSGLLQLIKARSAMAVRCGDPEGGDLDAALVSLADAMADLASALRTRIEG